MTQFCERCRRANPREATYCYHDGILLAGHSADGAGAVGARSFTVPFVFPSGRASRNFNELALACHEDPTAALSVLSSGDLTSFFGGLGRADLAGAARTAAGTADRERGLDELLGRLPGAPLRPARLRVEPATLNLGTLRPGQDRRVELTLRNEGQRLLFGSARCEVPWLCLGEGLAQRRKLFQFFARATLPVCVLGRHLRAFSTPQEAAIQLESNGGAVTVTVRVQVPVQPFPEGVLAGALSPRRLAARAQQAPREAAALIESGAVARWYQVNGWDYPLPAPTPPGIAAVQQLFEVLGLAKPPRVKLSEESVRLRGVPGETIEHVLEVVPQENRPAMAQGSSDQPWLRIGTTAFLGHSACVPLTVGPIPGRPGQVHQARVSITANGNQRFVVHVTLEVVGPTRGE
jgi:hypothetical protein